MSSPSSAGGTNGSAVIREGTRVILREITANLQNSPPPQSPRCKSGNEAGSIKGEQQHDVKVRFIREFADAAASGREANTESSLSSASSFQSLTSTLSSKCSSGICVDSSPARASDTSYISAEIPGLDDLISACENIRLNDRTLDLSKDQSFNLELDGEDLSGDQTFASAVDRNSLDRTREIFEANSPVNIPPDITQDLDNTRTLDEDKETSTANAYFECGTVDIVEASRYHQANSELASLSETFVQCVTNLEQIDPTLDGKARDKLEVVELAKTDETHENLEILVNNKNADNLQVDNINNVGNSTLSLNELTANSTATLESVSDLIVDDAEVQLKEIECSRTSGRNKVAEQTAQSSLDTTDDCPSDLKQFESLESTRPREGAEKSAQSILDATVEFTSDLKQFESSGSPAGNEVPENPAQSILDATVEFTSDLKQFESPGSPGGNEVPENSAQSILDATVEFTSDLKQFESIESTRPREGAEKSAQSILDATVEFTSDLKQSESPGSRGGNEVPENPAQSILDATVEFTSDLKQFESPGSPGGNEVPENSAQSILDATVEFTSDLKQFENPGSPGGNEVPENSAQSILDATVEFTSDLKQFESLESTRPREGAEKSAQSILDATVEFTSDLKQSESPGSRGGNEVPENPAQSILDATVEFTSDLKQFESPGSPGGNEVPENSAQSILDATVEFTSDLKQFENPGSPGGNEVPENSAQSILDATVEFTSDLKQFESIESTRPREGAEKSAQSILDATVEFTSDLKQYESPGSRGGNEVPENLGQSILDATVDFTSDLKQFENPGSPGGNDVPEKSAQSILDATVDFTSDLKQFESPGSPGGNEVPENPVQSVLDVTADFPSDLKQFESTEPTRQSEVTGDPTRSVLDVDFTSDLERLGNVGITRKNELAENLAESILNGTVDFTNDSKEIKNVEVSELSEVTENSVQSSLNITVDIPSRSQEIADTQPSDFEVNEQVHPKSVSDVFVADISSVESHECYKPLTPALSELSDNSQCPTLPTLSSICLRAPFVETDVPLGEQAVETVRSTEDTIPTVAVPTLSEKFANIAAIDIPHGNSISTIQAPTFLNAQKFVEDSTEFEDNLPALKTEAAISNVENIDKTGDPDFEIAQNVGKVIQPSVSEVCEFKKPLLPVPNKILSSEPPKREDKETNIHSVDSVEVEKHDIPEADKSREADSSTGSEDLNATVTIQDISAGNIFAVAESDQYAEFLPQQQSTALTLEGLTVNSHKSGLVASARLINGDNLESKPISLPDDYAAFVPQQQSTTLTGFADRPLNKLERQPTPFVTAPLLATEAVFNIQNNKSPRPTSPIDNRCNFEKLELAAKAVANDIYNTSLEIEDDNSTRFVSATSELFHDPGSFDFLLSKTPRKNTRRDLRAESLYVKFDPLVSNTSMLPQGNIQNTSPPVNEERNGENNTTISNIATPKRNPAIAAIDRLLFYSPMTTTTTPTTNTANTQKANDSQEKMEPTEETNAETVNMAKELELVRSTVIQLEEQLEKLKIDHEEALEKQSSYQEKINQLQTQLAQEIKNKNQITVVVDEYEKSISRLVAEKERDRKNLDVEKAKLLEELAAAKRHLENSEAAFNDVHLKYERLKAVAAAYKSNEVALKQSAQKNVEIIKSLEFRNEQVKEHATARLEKANQELDAMMKQHEAEKVRLHAMVKKAELKSKSLAELVEQKTKENKELTEILDEVIARVGRNKSE